MLSTYPNLGMSSACSFTKFKNWEIFQAQRAFKTVLI